MPQRTPIEALSFIHRQPVDLVFLDIQMPQLTGLQLANLIGAKARIIFTTAYATYALDGFEHSAVDYLLKPISFERFYKAALKAKEWLDRADATSIETPRSAPLRAYTFVKTEAKLVKVLFDSLLYVKAMQNYCLWHTTQAQLMTLQTMRQTQEQLADERFIRVHKSFCINLDKIDAVERNRIYIEQSVIPIGESYREPFYQRLNTNRG